MEGTTLKSAVTARKTNLVQSRLLLSVIEKEILRQVNI